MPFTIPTAPLLMQTDWDLDARARGAWTDGSGSPNTRNTKAQGSLPLTGSNATSFTNSTNAELRGVYWEFEASPGYDMTDQHRIMIWTHQYNAPNRLEIDDLAGGGIRARLATGAGSPPTVRREWVVGGNDSRAGTERGFPVYFVIDMEDDSYDASSGTWDNTDIQCMGSGHFGAGMGGTTTMWFLQRLFVLETTKNATDIPRFTGTSDWDDVITAMGTAYDDKITHGWLAREGDIFSIACPIEIGNNSTETDFNDNGASVFWPNHNDPVDPRVRVTSDAFRVYLNLRDNSADTATFSGFYDAGNSNPPWDFNQGNAAVVTFNSPTFKNTGQFDLGTSITGPATWDGCGVVVQNDAGADIDGSTFRNPNGDHLLQLSAVPSGFSSGFSGGFG